MERCPVCRARFNDEPLCHRCHSDLSALLKIEQEADAQVARAIECFVRKDIRAMEQAVCNALSLKASPLARVLLSLSRSGQKSGDVPTAFESGPFPQPNFS